MGLIELMIAMVVLVFGMLALMMLVGTSTGSNNRNKLDTTGTMLAQTVLEGISASKNATFTLNDCNSNALTVAATGAAGGTGAQLDANGNVDWANESYASVTANYKMKYVSCGANAGAVATYEVRWNVRALTAYTKLVTVSARQLGVPGDNSRLPFFAPPITLRTIAGL